MSCFVTHAEAGFPSSWATPDGNCSIQAALKTNLMMHDMKDLGDADSEGLHSPTRTKQLRLTVLQGPLVVKAYRQNSVTPSCSLVTILTSSALFTMTLGIAATCPTLTMCEVHRSVTSKLSRQCDCVLMPLKCTPLGISVFGSSPTVFGLPRCPDVSGLIPHKNNNELSQRLQ